MKYPVARGHVFLQAVDAITGEVLETRDDSNVVVNDARIAFINAIRTTDSAYRLNNIKIANDIGVGISPHHVVDFGGSVTSGGSTGLTNDATTYTIDVNVDNTIYNVSVVGSSAQTFGDLVTELNADITGATVTIDSGNIKLTNNSTDPTGLAFFDDSTDALFLNCTGFSSFNTPVDENAPESAVKTYDATTMPAESTILYDRTAHGRSGGLLFGTETSIRIIVNHTIVGSEVMSDLGLNQTDSRKFTSIGLHTGNGNLFAYQRFARLSVSGTININVVWYIEYTVI